jgi:4-hydroxy-tetrahydrodipicolinate synthase
VVGLKDSSGDWATTEAFLDIDGLTVWPGAELPLLDALDRGSPGCITATANVNPGPVVKVIRQYGEGGREAATDAMERARAYRLALQGPPAISTMKRLLALRHDDPTWATVRPPFVEMNEAEGRTLMERLAAI